MTIHEWNQSVEAYEKLVFTICFQLVRDYQQAQDLTQETFLSAYTHRESCRMDTVKPWLARIATNKAKDYLKSAYVRRVNGELNENTQDDTALPEQLFLEKESREKIIAHVTALDEPYAKVSQLYFLEHKSVSEITVLLSRPQKTVQTQLYRAKKILQEKIKEGDTHEVIR